MSINTTEDITLTEIFRKPTQQKIDYLKAELQLYNLNLLWFSKQHSYMIIHIPQLKSQYKQDILKWQVSNGINYGSDYLRVDDFVSDWNDIANKRNGTVSTKVTLETQNVTHIPIIQNDLILYIRMEVSEGGYLQKSSWSLELTNKTRPFNFFYDVMIEEKLLTVFNDNKTPILPRMINLSPYANWSSERCCYSIWEDSYDNDNYYEVLDYMFGTSDYDEIREYLSEIYDCEDCDSCEYCESYYTFLRLKSNESVVLDDYHKSVLTDLQYEKFVRYQKEYLNKIQFHTHQTRNSDYSAKYSPSNICYGDLQDEVFTKISDIAEAVIHLGMSNSDYQAHYYNMVKQYFKLPQLYQKSQEQYNRLIDDSGVYSCETPHKLHNANVDNVLSNCRYCSPYLYDTIFNPKNFDFEYFNTTYDKQKYARKLKNDYIYTTIPIKMNTEQMHNGFINERQYTQFLKTLLATGKYNDYDNDVNAPYFMGYINTDLFGFNSHYILRTKMLKAVNNTNEVMVHIKRYTSNNTYSIEFNKITNTWLKLRQLLLQTTFDNDYARKLIKLPYDSDFNYRDYNAKRSMLERLHYSEILTNYQTYYERNNLGDFSKNDFEDLEKFITFTEQSPAERYSNLQRTANNRPTEKNNIYIMDMYGF